MNKMNGIIGKYGSNASSPWSGLLLGLTGYVLLCRLLRYRARDSKVAQYPYKTKDDLKHMTTEHASEIQLWLFYTEFPFTTEKALEFALFRTYAIPTISKLLMKTRQLSNPQLAAKRYVDTVVLIAEFIANRPDSERAISSIARMNYIHGIYQNQGLISNDDLLYTLSLFALEPWRWVDRYEWRTLTDMEICALGTFWKAQGDAMNISYKDMAGFDSWSSGLEWIHDIQAWSEAYEKRCMVFDINNKMTADETTKLLLYDVPKFAHPWGRLVVSCLLDDRLRTAMMYEQPPESLKKFLNGAFIARKFFLRWFALPRPWIFRAKNISDQPDSNGRLYLSYYESEPWYIKTTFWNLWGPYALFKRLTNRPIPDAKYSPNGYTIPEIGPKIAQGKGQKEHDMVFTKLMGENRGGCPFSGVAK